MDAIHDVAPGGLDARILLIMLPGARDTPEDLASHGFIRAIRERSLAVDVVAVDAHLGYYLERTVAERLEQDIIASARARGYKRIWFMGISLGGLGSLIYARAHPGEVEGEVLLAPFLSNRGLIDDVIRAGGLDRWQPGEIAADDEERQLLAWLKAYRTDEPRLPKIYLGYGTGDRFAPASALLATRLPVGQVATIEGGHDWPTWFNLWNQLLDKGLFTVDHGAMHK